MIKKDSLALGIILGIIGPIAGFWIYYLMKYKNFNHIAFLKEIVGMHLSSAVLSLCLLSNLAIFFIFIHYKCDFSARGVLLATIIYAVLGFFLKFFL